jgi:hypothetical protein
MAASVDSRFLSVFPVVPSRHSAGPKRPLAELSRLPDFRVSPESSWDHEYQRNQARGEKSWFLLDSAPRVTIFWYGENGGIPYEAVAARPRAATGGVKVSTAGGLMATPKIRTFRSPAGRPVSMLTTVLQAPEYQETAEPTAWWAQLINRENKDATSSPPSRKPTLMGLLLAWLRR